MANSPYQLKSDVESEIVLQESERSLAQSSNTRNFVFPTMTLKDEPIRFVDYTEVADNNCEQYDSQNSAGTYNQSLETPALLQRWSEENFKAEPTSDNSFLISGNSASVSQQPLSGLRSGNSQSRSTDCASSTLESQSSTDKIRTERRQENARRRQLYEATIKALKSNEEALRASAEALKSSKEAWKSSEKACKSREALN